MGLHDFVGGPLRQLRQTRQHKNCKEKLELKFSPLFLLFSAHCVMYDAFFYSRVVTGIGPLHKGQSFSIPSILRPAARNMTAQESELRSYVFAVSQSSSFTRNSSI